METPAAERSSYLLRILEACRRGCRHRRGHLRRTIFHSLNARHEGRRYRRGRRSSSVALKLIVGDAAAGEVVVVPSSSLVRLCRER
uniref:Uncharacterized protein n=1 Tax=Oryza punctata TaxID=4537 RepID=A0A0E0KEU2_ORYPU